MGRFEMITATDDGWTYETNLPDGRLSVSTTDRGEIEFAADMAGVISVDDLVAELPTARVSLTNESGGLETTDIFPAA